MASTLRGGQLAGLLPGAALAAVVGAGPVDGAGNGRGGLTGDSAPPWHSAVWAWSLYTKTSSTARPPTTTKRAQKDYRAARRFRQRSLEIADSLGEQRAIAEGLEELARVDAAEGHAERAAALLGASQALRD